MFVPQDLIVGFLGSNPAMYALAGLILLILIDLVLTVWIANKSKTDDIDFKLLPDFIQPTLTYAIFIIVMEVLVIGGKGLPGLTQFFTGIEILGYAAILLKYWSKIKGKLKQLGMQIDESVERQIDSKVETISSEVGIQQPVYTPQPEQEYVPEGGIILPPPLEGRPEEDER